MSLAALLIVTSAIFLWGVFSARLEHADVTAPIVFVIVGALLAAGGLVEGPAAPEALKPLVELTLVWVLFADAAGVPVRELRADWSRCARLLLVGLPLTILAGWGLALWAFPGWESGSPSSWVRRSRRPTPPSGCRW
jgi:NhaP-type Na+/H+ or K+/H+ antiporter